MIFYKKFTKVSGPAGDLQEVRRERKLARERQRSSSVELKSTCLVKDED